MSLAHELGPHLPYLRRYARALTGSQERGDAFVRATLLAIVDNPACFPAKIEARTGLYKLFHTIWSTVNIEVDSDGVAGDPARAAEDRLRQLTPQNRQALLLTAMEGFANAETAQIIGVDENAVDELLVAALAEIDSQIATNVLIIEDEPIISMDLEEIVRELGHGVSGTAVTHKEAVSAAKQHKPGLVLADIQLADGSSGIEAVKDILNAVSVPVIFITAFPERLLTGDRPEPTFLITKPFQRTAVKAAISQALFLNSSVALAS
ncbi:response regulator [Parvibaculum sp.]|uniref:response regulator n=1 Tax=Parvibaculum sp. TaxID=2024848 RepID=UPI002CDF54A8|nr:response regulator [Parvibaculum sp.]HUD50452.1 response regulator [Parvibaculum sp.]